MQKRQNPLEEIDERIYRRAARIIAKGELHAPIMVVIPNSAEEPSIVNMERIFRRADAVECIEEIITSMFLQNLPIDVVVVIAEGYLVRVPNKFTAEALLQNQEELHAYPTRHPAIIVTYCTPTGLRATTAHRIHRNETPPRLERGELNIESPSVIMEGAWFGPLHNYINKTIH